MRVGVAAAGAVVLLVAACGDDGGASTGVHVERIRPALAAVEARLGGPQRYSEVNVTPSEVNVFVVRDGVDEAYVVRDGSVESPTSGVPYAGPTFAAGDLAFTAAVLDRLSEELPDSPVLVFSATPAAGGGVDYIATLGSNLRVLLSPDGAILGVE
jgi:hypothetical protein